MELTVWMTELKQNVPKFLERMKSQTRPGFFHYSLTGDTANEQTRWGLGNAVFATKIYYTLGILNTFPASEQQMMSDFIRSFQAKNGSFFDPCVAQKAFWREKISSIRKHDFNNFFHQQTIRAETRQAISALTLLGEKISTCPSDLPTTNEGIEKFLSELDWKKPWGAGSHFSHLLFFLSHGVLPKKDELIDQAIAWIRQIQNPETGAWHRGNPTLQQKINGTMKVLTGLRAANRMEFPFATQMIDLALNAQNDAHACDNFNVIYVLKYANEQTQRSYRTDEIKTFALNRISLYKKYYWPEHGGFSFFEGKANTHYYQAKISKGLHEPDIHGTVMFLWGLALISHILGIDNQTGFREFVA
jgi:hypothetical protein